MQVIILPQVKELTCDKFKSRCKLKKLPREKAIVEHLHLVLIIILCTCFFLMSNGGGSDNPDK